MVVDAGQFLRRDVPPRYLFLCYPPVDAYAGPVPSAPFATPQVDHANAVGDSVLSAARDHFPIWFLRPVGAVCADASSDFVGLSFL